MNVRLRTLLEEAETRLSEAGQRRLAEIVEAFVATHEGEEDFTQTERAHLASIDREPFREADPAEVAALFARRG